MNANPFTYGKPISDPIRFVGRQREVNHIFSRLCNVEFESSSLVGERRVGKTSLLNYIAHPNVRRSYGLDPDIYLFIYVDLQMVNKSTTPAQLWQQLLRKMIHNCQNLEAKKRIQEQVDKADLSDTFALADIFNCVTENQNFGLDFFYGLRSLAINYHLSLITSSRHELIELCHSEAIRSSPFFNIFANINLRLFTNYEAQVLISDSLKKTGINFTNEEVVSILDIAGYHPYFLQSACFFMFKAYSENLASSEHITYLRKAFREETAPHLNDYWSTSTDREKIVLTILALLERKGKVDDRKFSTKQLQNLYSRSDQVLVRLEKRSLLSSKDDTYSLFNTSFGEWICNEITDTMQDKQSYDEWLGSNKGVMERLSGTIRKNMDEILPQVSGKYRELIITWISDPKNLSTVASTAAFLFKAALGMS